MVLLSCCVVFVVVVVDDVVYNDNGMFGVFVIEVVVVLVLSFRL